ncbi:type VI secretion system baseplate subunit TssE [Dyella tabacisoli]|uniref:Type VI secretion system baseplate subunit TssE n=1 Tax=Dyella tabacisoli TaxID=2282381 RepID=A0A369UJ76_9GAMM|nr:type VI secretion system baseplate subunit TssE [Dyella tabacisoli]RDD80175.1 type VI secretion system baseplate subunit TssE [Dyella tabacisoli]
MAYSLIDRLTLSQEHASARGSLHSLRVEISRDLEDLLNTRSEGARLIPEAFKECRKSSLTYGIPDFSSFSLLSPRDRDRIRRALEQAIALHEPRLTRVRVQLESQGTYERALRFRIDALINLGPEREKVQFDAVLQLSTQSYRIG